MTRILIFPVAAVVGSVMLAAAASAQDPNLYSAQSDLEAAWGHLQATPYGGSHRDKALSHIRKALDEVHQAQIAPFPGGKQEKQERKREKRGLKQERKREKREEHLERKEQQREEKLEERGH